MKKLLLLTIISLFATAIHAKTITVISDSDSGTGTLRQAFMDAEDGDSIIFADNVVSILLLTRIDIEKNITVTGNIENNTEIKRNGNGNDKNNHFYIIAGHEATLNYLTLLDGYVFCSGGAVSNSGTLFLNNCIFNNNRSSDNAGGAIANSGKLYAYNCIFTNNRTPSIGGAIYSRGDVYLENCIFRNNTGNNGGVFYISRTSTTTIIHCIIEENTGYIGSVIANYGKVIIDNCIFRKNRDIANYCLISNYSKEIIMSNSIFEEHQISIIYNSESYANVMAVNCLFAKNSGYRIINGEHYTVINSTFADNANTCLSFNSGSSDTTAYLYNNIFHNNTTDIYINGEDTALNVYNNIIENTNGLFNKTNILGENPLFVGNGNYHLQEGSPAINAGNNSFYLSNEYPKDLAGNNRINNILIDIGAYEYPSVAGITINPQSLTIEIGQQEQLSATIEPVDSLNRKIHWKSDDENIVTVDENGLVTALAEGNAVIIVSTENREFSDSCIVTVKQATIPVTGITLNPKSLTMEIGQQEQLSATIEPVDATNQKLHWKSDDENIVTIDENGLVTALAEGIAVITVTTEDGEFSDSSIVTVKQATIPVTGITLNPPNLTMEIGQQEQLSATIGPDDATNQKLHWKSDDENIVTIDENGLVTALAEGIAVITVTTEDGEFSDSCIVTVKNDVSISKINDINININISPNPTTGLLKIESDQLKINNVEIFDIYGKKLSIQIESGIEPSRIVLNLLALSKGIYLLRINFAEGEVVRKVVKQ